MCGFILPLCAAIMKLLFYIINDTTLFLEKYFTFYCYLFSIQSRMSFPRKPFQMQTSTILQINNSST